MTESSPPNSPDPDDLLRPAIRKLKPYASARDEFQGTGEVFLDANENPYQSPANRYPDPYQSELKAELRQLKTIPEGQLFIGHGSDEVIDLLYRAYCEPGQDKVLLFPPTYGMYRVSADINAVSILQIPLRQDNFQLDLEAIRPHLHDRTLKLAFVCSPNNPTGNCLDQADILTLAREFPGLVIVDEAYIDFAPEKSLLRLTERPPNLVIMQTLSKAWGLAGLRLGLCIADPRIIRALNKLKPPYNIGSLEQAHALQHLRQPEIQASQVRGLLEQRKWLAAELSKLDKVEAVLPSEANFLLVRFERPLEVYHFLAGKGIIVRDRSRLVPGCLRISVGLPEENQALIYALNQMPHEESVVH